MTSTITTPGPYDALEKAQPGEPMFPLLARDPCAPAAVTEWCRLRRNRAIRLYGDVPEDRAQKLLAAEMSQCAHAEAMALEMGEWRAQEYADEPADGATRSQEVERSEEERQAASDRERREKVIRNLREAAYHLAEAREGGEAAGLIALANLQGADSTILWINRIADELTELRHVAEPELSIEGERP